MRTCVVLAVKCAPVLCLLSNAHLCFACCQMRTCALLAVECAPALRLLSNAHLRFVCTAQGQARRGPTLHECVLLHAVARLALHPHITNIQVGRTCGTLNPHSASASSLTVPLPQPSQCLCLIPHSASASSLTVPLPHPSLCLCLIPHSASASALAVLASALGCPLEAWGSWVRHSSPLFVFHCTSIPNRWHLFWPPSVLAWHGTCTQGPRSWCCGAMSWCCSAMSCGVVAPCPGVVAPCPGVVAPCPGVVAPCPAQLVLWRHVLVLWRHVLVL